MICMSTQTSSNTDTPHRTECIASTTVHPVRAISALGAGWQKGSLGCGLPAANDNDNNNDNNNVNDMITVHSVNVSFFM